MSLPSVLTLSSLTLLILSQNLVISYSRYPRYPIKQKLDCLNNENCDNNEWSLSANLETLDSWNCDFSLDTCGIHNQHNMDSYFVHYSNNAAQVFGKKGLLYLDTAKAYSTGARLITPYFPTNGCRYACLTIEYLIDSNSVKNLYLIQQDIRDYCIWQKNNYSNGWTNSSITIDLTRGKPRFFFEARFDRYLNNFGFIAISNMRYQLGACDRSEANQCYMNRFFGTYI